MSAQTARIDAIETAVQSLLASQQTIIETLARLATPQTANAAPQTANAGTVRRSQSRAAKAARRAARSTNQATQAATAKTGPSFPKANAGTVSGIVVRTARQGYGVLVATTDGERWLNSPYAGPPIFSTLTVGQPVSYTVKDGGYIVSEAPQPTSVEESAIPCVCGRGQAAQIRLGKITQIIACDACQDDRENATPAAPQTATRRRAARQQTSTAALVADTAPAAPQTVKATIGQAGECVACGGRHTHDSVQKRILECLSRQYTRETGSEPNGVLDATFTAWAQARMSAPQTAQRHCAWASCSKLFPVETGVQRVYCQECSERMIRETAVPQTAPVSAQDHPDVARCGQPTKAGTPCKSRVDGARVCLQHPPATIATPGERLAPRQESAPVVETRVSEGKPADGKYTVELRQFPVAQKNVGKMVKVHALDGFQGNDGTGRWLTKLGEGIYSKLAKMVIGDRLSITIKEGTVSKVKRIASIESDTGVVAGVKASGNGQPHKQVTGTRADDTKTEARAARRRAAAKANGSKLAKCSGTAQHRATCAFWTTQKCSAES